MEVDLTGGMKMVRSFDYINTDVYIHVITMPLKNFTFCRKCVLKIIGPILWPPDGKS